MKTLHRLTTSRRSTRPLRTSNPRQRRLRFDQLEDRRMMAIGELDTTFGDAGVFRQGYALTQWASSVATAAVQSDGKILAIGSPYPNTAIARYNPDGSLDSTFGTDGRVLVDRITDGDHSRLVVVQGDRIFAARSIDGADGGSDMQVSRFHLDGSLDTIFGQGGQATIDFGADNAGPSLLLLNGDKIVVVGGVIRAATATDFAIAQLNADGSVDTGFGNGGTVTADFRYRRPSSIDEAFDDIVKSAVIQGNTLVVAGASIEDWRPCTFNCGNSYETGGSGGGGSAPQPIHTEDAVFAKYSLVDGSLDATFGSSGKVIVPEADAISIGSAAALPDGGVLLGGQIEGSFALLRLTSSGQLNGSFGTNGRVVGTPTVGGRGIGSLLIQGNRIFAIGSVWDTSHLAGYNLLDGALDTTFGDQGVIFNDNAEFFIGGILHDDGFIVFGHVGDFPESTYYSDPRKFALRGYTASGQPDSTFNGGQVVATDFDVGPGADGTLDTARLPDGRLLVLGHNSDGYSVLLRMSVDGTLDGSFGNQGTVEIDPHVINANTIALQGDKILLLQGGSSRLARFNADGTIDETFGDQGVSETPVVDLDPGVLTIYRAFNILITDVGIILVGDGTTLGWSAELEDYTQIDSGVSIIRLSSDGELISKSIEHFTASTLDGENVDDAALQDGKVVVSGKVDGQLVIARFQSDGSYDSSFGGTGVITTGVSSISGWMQILPTAGGVVVAGNLVDETGSYLALAQYQNDGNLDPSFGVNGRSITPVGFAVTDVNLASDVVGNLIVSGSDSVNSFVARFNGDGALDLGFGIAGFASLPLGQIFFNNNVQVDSDQNIYVAGTIFSPETDYDIAVVRIMGSLRPVTVNVTGGTFTYDGLPHQGDGSVSAVDGFGAAAHLTYYSGTTLLPGAPIAAGTYTVVASFNGDADHRSGSASAPLVILPKDLTATGSTQNTINIAKAGTITFTLSNVTGIVSGDGSVYDLFNGATFHLRVGVTDYSVTSTAAVLSDGSVQVAWRMTQELYNDLYALLGTASPSSKTLVDLFVSGTSVNGNYTLTEDILSRIFQQGKVIFS